MPSGAAAGRDAVPENPLSRAVAYLLLGGKPLPRLSMCFFDSGQNAFRWLGVFVHSAGDRILFFPGYAAAPTEIHSFLWGNVVWNQPFVFDHVSLESDLRTWHVTTAGSTEHLGGPRTLDLGESRVLWFGLSVADENALRLVRQKTVVTAPVPSSDSRRRIEGLIAARDKAQFPLISRNTDHPRRTEGSFLHFAFVVGSKGFPEYNGPEIAAPYNSPFLSTPLPVVLRDIPLRSHRVELSSTRELQITCCELPGTLKTPLTFTGPGGAGMPQGPPRLG